MKHKVILPVFMLLIVVCICVFVVLSQPGTDEAQMNSSSFRGPQQNSLNETQMNNSSIHGPQKNSLNETQMNSSSFRGPVENECETEELFRHHMRDLSICADGSGSFIGEKHHKLWWDEHQQYWFCGMNTSEISLFDSGKVPLPLLFNSNIKTTPALPTAMNASLRDGRETEHYKHTNMIVIAIQGTPPNTLEPETLGVDPIDGLAVDIEFNFTV